MAAGDSPACKLAESNSALRREIEILRFFKKRLWQSSLQALRSWARREGLDPGPAATDEPPEDPPDDPPNDPMVGPQAMASSVSGGMITVPDLPPPPCSKNSSSNAHRDPPDGVPDTDAETTGEMDHEAVYQEQRRYPRASVRQRVRFRVKGAASSTTAELVDLSVGGLFIRTDQRLRPGTIVACGFYLGHGNAREVLAKGQVAWTARDARSGRTRGFGLKFIKVASEHLTTIARHIIEQDEDHISTLPGWWAGDTIPDWPARPLL